MLVFKHFFRDIYDEVKFINNRFGKVVIVNMGGRGGSFQPEVCKLSNERNAIVLASVKYFSK